MERERGSLEHLKMAKQCSRPSLRGDCEYGVSFDSSRVKHGERDRGSMGRWRNAYG